MNNRLMLVIYTILLQSFFSLGGPSLVILLNVVGLVLAFYLFSKASSKLGSIESVSIGLIFQDNIISRNRCYSFNYHDSHDRFIF